MHKSTQVIVLKKNVFICAAAICVCMLALLVTNKIMPVMSNSTSDVQYVILGSNDLGMHCIQKDYSSFLLLPPANNLRIQVFRKQLGGKAVLVNSGIVVTYEMIDNTTSADKINFWDYAKDYGFDVEKNVGITGNSLKGEMELSSDKKYYQATAIPVTPYTDSDKTKLQPYQVAKISIKDEKTQQELAVVDSMVVPVSDEMNCGQCHGNKNTDVNILTAHDKLSGTQLIADLNNNIRHKCADCHQDNALGAKGVEGVLPLSEAMHGFHQSKMSLSTIEPKCYSCHPGPVTQCYRGAMDKAGISCDNEKCHGDMQQIAGSQKEGRQAWIQEPNCSNCHGDTYATNANTLYKDSYLQNAPGTSMNNLVRCESCHNSTHAEWKSTLPIDNVLPKQILGYESYLNKCSVCHAGTGKMHKKGK